MEKHFIERFKAKILILTLILLFSTINLFAQQRTVSGKILDGNDEPVIGANIMEKGTTNGTISDFDGKFTLKVGDSPMLIVSFLGYAKQEISVRDKTNISVKLVEDFKTLDEVVVIGYGSARKKDLTGAVAQVKASQLQNESPSSMQDLLRANVPGVNVGFNAGGKSSSD